MGFYFNRKTIGSILFFLLKFTPFQIRLGPGPVYGFLVFWLQDAIEHFALFHQSGFDNMISL